MERRNQYSMDEEHLKHQDLVNKLYAAQIEDQTNYSNQLKNLELQLNSFKTEHSVQLKKIEDLNMIIELKDSQIYKEELKVKKLSEEISELNTNMNYFELENANQIAQYDKQIKQLMIEQDEIQNELNAKENSLINLQNNNLAVQNEVNLMSKLDIYEHENQQLKNEIEQLNSNLDILNAQIYKSNFDDSIHFNFNSIDDKISATKNESSFETEINTMSKEEVTKL